MLAMKTLSFAVLAALLAGCDGSLGAPCYGNNTCDDGLECVGVSFRDTRGHTHNSSQCLPPGSLYINGKPVTCTVGASK